MPQGLLCNNNISYSKKLEFTTQTWSLRSKTPRDIYMVLSHIYSFVPFPTREKPDSLSRIFSLSSQIVNASILEYNRACYVSNNQEIIRKQQDQRVYGPRTPMTVNPSLRDKRVPQSLPFAIKLAQNRTLMYVGLENTPRKPRVRCSRPKKFLDRELQSRVPKCALTLHKSWTLAQIHSQLSQGLENTKNTHSMRHYGRNL